MKKRYKEAGNSHHICFVFLIPHLKGNVQLRRSLKLCKIREQELGFIQAVTQGFLLQRRMHKHHRHPQHVH